MTLSPAQQKVIDNIAPGLPVCVSKTGGHAYFPLAFHIKIRSSTIYALVKKGLLIERDTTGKPWYRTDYYLVEEMKE